MPARRRFPGSESDENFSVLIDSGDGVSGSQQQNKNSNLIDDPYSGDEKKKYATTNSYYSVGGFSVPTGLTKWSTNIGSFLQQQIVQAQNVNVEQIFFENNQNDAKPIAVSAAAIDATVDNSNFDEFEEKVEELVVMACRDRTGEFVNAIRSMQGRNIARAVNIRDPRKATQLQSYSEFMMIAKHIGKNIASTYSKLEKLTLCENFFNRAVVRFVILKMLIWYHFTSQWPKGNLCLMIDRPKYRSWRTSLKAIWTHWISKLLVCKNCPNRSEKQPMQSIYSHIRRTWC